MKPVDWTPLIKKYKGLWVALKHDEETVVASGKDIKKVHTEAINKGLKTPIMFKVPSKIVSYVG